MKTSRMSLFAGLTLIAVAQLVHAKPMKYAPSHQTMKVVSLVENGPIVSFRLDNGTTVDVPKVLVHVRDVAKKRTPSASLAELSSRPNLAALATFVYTLDGTIKRARLHVFTNEQEMNAFKAQRAANKEQRR